jgi:hypothetical protein
MDIRYLYATPAGAQGLGEADLQKPFLLAPGQQHPFLRLSDYFKGIERHLLNNGGDLDRAIAEYFPKFPGLGRVREMTICSEKHGALYHISRVSLLGGNHPPFTLAVTAAVTDTARLYLENEFAILQALNQSRTPSFLPTVFNFGRETCQTEHGTENMVIMVGVWLSGYHEWHLENDTSDNRKKIRLWDMEQGERFLADAEAFAVIKKTAHILTVYYDPASGRQIWPWHHAAGDFVVSGADKRIDVRMITARNYLPIMDVADGAADTAALVVFFLLLTMRIRVDRQRGVEAVIWFDDFAVSAAAAGFFEALVVHESAGRITAGSATEFLNLLRSFEAADFLRMAPYPLEYFDNDEELAVIRGNLQAHCRTVQAVLADLTMDD